MYNLNIDSVEFLLIKTLIRDIILNSNLYEPSLLAVAKELNKKLEGLLTN